MTSVDTTMRELERANRRLRHLVEFSRDIRTQADVRVLLLLAVRHVVNGVGCGGAAVLLYDEAHGAISTAEVHGMGDSFRASWLEAIRGVGLSTGSELALAHRRKAPYLCSTVSTDPELEAVRDLILDAGRRTVAVVPLLSHGEFLGMMAFYDCPVEIMQADGVGYLQDLADTTAAAVRSAQLHTETQLELRRRDTLREVVAAISSELDRQSLLERVAASAVSLLEATRGSISLVQSNGTARIEAVHNMDQGLLGAVLGPGDGLMGQVLLTRQAVVVENYAEDLPRPLPGLEDSRAGISVPIWWHDRMVGVFSVFSSDRSRRFDRAAQDAMAMLADHVAIAIENARLFGELQERLGDLLALQQIGTALIEERDFDRVLQLVCEQLLQLTSAEGIGLALLEENGQYLNLRTVVGPAARDLVGARIPLEGSLAGVALRTDRPQRSNDAQNDPRGYQPSLTLGNTHSLLSVPMKSRQRTVGVLSAYNKRDAVGFTERDGELAILFGNQAAAAIENARLHEQTREYAVVEERNRLARELHDSVTQSLFSVTLLTQAALNLWERDPAKARERLDRAGELAQGALAEMRALIFQLRPMALQEEGLVQALRKHITALRTRDGLEVALEITGDERRLPNDVEEAAFRIIQESLNNVVKHAQVDRAAVYVAFAASALILRTEDAGAGFTRAPAAPSAGRSMGLASMHERVQGVGGTISIDSEPGRGTRVLAELPLP